MASRFEVDFASPDGPNPPLDPSSVEVRQRSKVGGTVAPDALQRFKEDARSVEFLNDSAVKQKLADAIPLASVDPKDYEAIFYVGGSVKHAAQLLP